MNVSPHGNNTNSVDLPPQALIQNSRSSQTTPAFDSSTTCLLSTTSCATDSDPIACPNTEPEDGLETSTKSSRGTISVLLKNWKWEIAACGLVLAVPAIMVATVFPHRNQPIPQWPFKISINAMLAIYTLVFKSAIAYAVTSCVGQLQWAWFSSGSRPLSDVILFDDAGRSPWGLLAILWAHRLRQPLTILAAVIMISGLAIDPFIQQIIQPFDCSIPLNEAPATLPRTNIIDSYFTNTDEGQISAHTIRSALIAGLSSSGSSASWECSTGNCTFPDVYSTLGVCSACEDLSADIVVDSTRLDSSSYCDTHEITTHLSPADKGNYYGVNHNQLHTSFLNACNVDHHTDVAHMDVWSPTPLDDSSVRIDIVVGKTTYSDDRRLISTGQNIIGCDSAEANNTWACRGYGAASCTLKPCVRTYSASIQGGHLTERLISQSPDIPWGTSWEPGYFGVLDTHCVSAQQATFLTARGYELNNATRWIPFNGDLSSDDSSDERDSNDWLSNLKPLLQQKCVYQMSRFFMNKVGYGNDMGPFVRNPTASHFIGTVQGLMWDRTKSDERVVNTFAGPEVLQHIYNYGRVDFERIQSVFQNLSDSLTTFVRTHGNASYSEPVKGQVQHYAICLGIQWPWIALPATLAVLTILFLILVVESTGRHGTPLWKASPLPWILGGGLEVGNGTSPVSSQGRPKRGASVARMEDDSRHILATVSEGTAPRIEMVVLRDNGQVVDEWSETHIMRRPSHRI